MQHVTKRIASALAITALIGGQACTDLEETPYGGIPEAEYGQTEAQFIAALGAAYSGLFGLPGGHGGYWSITEISSDEAIIPQRGSDWFDGGIWLRTHSHTWNVNEPGFNNAWNQLFGGIATCNRLIETLENLNPELAPTFINELRGLRALYYYWAIDNFGNVPIVTNFADADPTPATANRQEVYNFIVGELTEIIPTLDQSVNQSTYARINANTARAILAKMYLNAEVYTGTSRWDELVSVTDEIIDGGAYILEPNFHANFSSDNGPQVRETIFAIPYDRVFGRNFNLGAQTNHYVAQPLFAATQQPWNGFASVTEFYNSFEDEDNRKGVYGDPGVPGTFLAGPLEFNGAALTDPSFEEADLNGAPVEHRPELSGLGLIEVIPDEWQQSSLREEGVRVYKYNYQNGFDPGSMDNDFPIFRYADVLLMKAEGLWRQDNGSDEALSLVNMVRMRAGVDAFEELNADNLLAERGREMAFEMWRRSDQIRFGKFTTGSWTFKNASEDYRRLFPIPFEQIQANPNLVQNPGY